MDVQLKSYELRVQLDDEAGIASCKAQMGYLQSQFGHDETALKEYNESLEIWRRRGNKAGMGNVLMSMGTLKLKINKLDEAKADLTESMQLRQDLNEINGVFGSANYLSTVYLKELAMQPGPWNY